MKNLIFLLFVMSFSLLSAQDFELDWAYPMGTSQNGSAWPLSMDSDAEGNIYVAGWFNGVVDMDLGPNVQEYSAFAPSGSGNGFLCRYTIM